MTRSETSPQILPSPSSRIVPIASPASPDRVLVGDLRRAGIKVGQLEQRGVILRELATAVMVEEVLLHELVRVLAQTRVQSKDVDRSVFVDEKVGAFLHHLCAGINFRWPYQVG